MPTSPVAPMNVKGSDAVDLDDCCLRGVTEHRGSLWDECVTPGPHLCHGCAVKFIAYTKVERSLYDRNVLIDRMSMRRDDTAGQFPDAHHKRTPRHVRITMKNFYVFRHCANRDYAVLLRTLADAWTRNRQQYNRCCS